MTMKFGSAGSKNYAEQVAKSGNGPSIGDMRESMLSEAEFQTLNGSSWVLCDGRDVSGSAYHDQTGSNLIPDARGLFRRAKNNERSDGNEDPTGERALGHFQDHAVADHYHQITNPGTNSTQTGSTQFVGGPNYQSHTINSGNPIGTNTDPDETRPKNIAVNVFIKINW